MKHNRNFLKKWLCGQTDWTALLHEDAPQPETPVERYQPKPDPDALQSSLRHSQRFYHVTAVVLCVIFAAIMLATVANLPRYGSDDAPTVNEVTERYVAEGTAETGAVNTVAGMILDYRAFDTLGESFVLFTALCTVTILMNATRRRLSWFGAESVNYYHDVIVRTVCRVLIPITLVFGIYILVNGHLSPGGGFSGGAILASALIIYAMVWGDERATRAIPRKTIRITVLGSLGFYCLSKGYSFFTGANHLPSFISPGTPGRIFSAGLILPLNVAVGLVVCCTMYSFYMYFRRGEL